MEFGTFMEFHVREGMSQAHAFDESFAHVDMAEELGLDGVWLAEDHFVPHRSVLSAPLEGISGLGPAADSEPVPPPGQRGEPGPAQSGQQKRQRPRHDPNPLAMSEPDQHRAVPTGSRPEALPTDPRSGRARASNADSPAEHTDLIWPSGA